MNIAKRIAQSLKSTRCSDPGCKANHCPKCGGHKLGWSTPGLCGACENKERKDQGSSGWGNSGRSKRLSQSKSTLPKTFAGLRLWLAKQLSPYSKRASAILRDTGYEGGGVIQSVFNVWDELQREYEDEIKQIGSNASEFKNNKVIKAECWAKACRNTAYLLHDCVINALDTGTRGGLNPMDFAPGDAPKAPKMKDISVIAEQVEQAFESLAESTLDDLYTSPEFTQTITRMSGGTTYKSIPPGVKL